MSKYFCKIDNKQARSSWDCGLSRYNVLLHTKMLTRERRRGMALITLQS